MKSYSLKWRLVSTIILAFAILWSMVFFWLYWDLEKRLQNTLDERLSASAHMVARLIQQLPLSEIKNTLGSVQEKYSSYSLIACEVSILSSDISVGQKVIAKTKGSPENLAEQKVGFSTWEENGVEWRTYVFRKGQIQVVAAEKLHLRYTLLKQILQSVLIPLVITLFLCIFLILWIIKLEFRPLDRITENLIEKKDNLSDATSYLVDLKTKKIPKEIQPFVDNLLGLIHRLHNSLENEKVFSAYAAHELRSPLTAIKTHVQLSQLILSQSQPSQASVIDNLKKAEYSIQRYEQLLEQLLMLSKTELQLQKTEKVISVEVKPVLESVILELQVKYPDISNKLYIQWQTITPLKILTVDLHIVLRNLIENAYLHAQSLTPIEISMQNNRLTISDDGIGLNDEEFRLLTQRFWRKSSQNDGYGLGLPLVKTLLEKYGYAIDFEHNIPHGLKVVISSSEIFLSSLSVKEK